MQNDRPELYAKLNSLINKYGGDESIKLHIDELPNTVKELIFNSEELLIRFGLVEHIIDLEKDKGESI